MNVLFPVNYKCTFYDICTRPDLIDITSWCKCFGRNAGLDNIEVRDRLIYEADLLEGIVRSEQVAFPGIAERKEELSAKPANAHKTTVWDDFKNQIELLYNKKIESIEKKKTLLYKIADLRF